MVELRGLTCILLVAYHVVGIPGAGMQVADGSIYRYAADSFELINMPLFTLISGLVYALNPAWVEMHAIFFLKKLRRLGFPFLVVSALCYFLQTRAPEPTELSSPIRCGGSMSSPMPISGTCRRCS